MDFPALQARALEIRSSFERWERRRYGRSWTLEELALGLLGDLGDLAKLIQAHEGVRDVDDLPGKLEHELADVLWSVIVIADRVGVDLQAAFVETMDQLDLTLRGDVS